MKQSVFIISLFVFALIISIGIYEYGLGNPANFKDSERAVPTNLMGQAYTGGPLVALLITLSIMDFAIIIERTLSLKRAAGKKAINKFFKSVLTRIKNNEIDQAIQECDLQRGSVANVIKTGLQRYKELSFEKKNGDSEKYLVEIQRTVEEAMMLETPLLEKNLIALSTIASIATMVGLLGTVLGMIRSFKALAQAGAPDAIALATGISEALVNTAGGLFVAILGIVAYNFFVNKVDNFTYQVDEASYNVMQILKTI